MVLDNPEIIILAAGKGTRLGGSTTPKPLTKLPDGETILGRQIKFLKQAYGQNKKVNIIVGYQHQLIEKATREHNHIFASGFASTNTSKSLLLGLKNIDLSRGVLWLNGDVVFDGQLPYHLANQISEQQKSFVTVNTDKVDVEEVKYMVDSAGYINNLSKQVPTSLALGEAVGINFYTPEDVKFLIKALEGVADDEYFEAGIEETIKTDNVKVVPFDITKLGLKAVEVDFTEDLIHASSTFFRFSR